MNLEFSVWWPMIGAVLIGGSVLFILWMWQREPKPRAPSGPTITVTANDGGRTGDAVAIGTVGVSDDGKLDRGNFVVTANKKGVSTRALAMGRTTEKGFQNVWQNPTSAEEGPGCYKMEAVPRGLCLIINNIHFEKRFPPRYSAKETAEPLKKLFEKFQFNTLYWENKSADMMMTAIRSVAKKDHSQYDCFVCFVLTHGAEHKLLGSDGNTIELKEFISAVSDQHCASLKGKPKLFFIEACRTGDPIQREIKSLSESLSSPDDDAESELIDYFVGYSTQRYQKSYRNNESGNIYVQEFISVMNDMGQREDLLGIMTKVNENVHKRGVYDGEGVKRRQFPDMWNKLGRRLYF